MNTSNIKLRQIEAFAAVARCEQFTLAADSLHITQPALSSLVRELEIALNIALFDRTTRKVRLTSAGATFLPIAERILGDVETIVSASNDLSALRQGHATIACSTVMAATELPAIIADFRSRYSGIRIIVRDAVEQDLADLVVQESVDIAIATEVEPDPMIEQLTISEDKLMLFMRADDELASQAQATWRQVAGRNFVSLARSSPLRRLTDQTVGRLGLFFRTEYEVGFASTILAFVEAGCGLAILPSNALQLRPSDKIVAMPLVEPVVSRKICLMRHRQRPLSPAAAQFHEHLQQWMSAR